MAGRQIKGNPVVRALPRYRGGVHAGAASGGRQTERAALADEVEAWERERVEARCDVDPSAGRKGRYGAQ